MHGRTNGNTYHENTQQIAWIYSDMILEMISIVILDDILSIDETLLNGFTSRSNDTMDCDDTDEESY